MDKTMSNTLKEKWLHLYEVTNYISMFEPWNRFYEDNCFAFVPKENKETYFFSFIGESAGRCGIACYTNEIDYLEGRRRLTSENRKDEPVLFLQNAYMCFWGNREDISKESYEQIKELGFNFRGKGAWLHFTRFEVGYLPVLLEEKEVDLMICAFENLFMMLKAIYEGNLDPKFEYGNTLIRWYSEKDKIYYTHPHNVHFSKHISDDIISISEEESQLQRLKEMPTSDYSIQLDWGYVTTVMANDDNKDYFPLVLLAKTKGGLLLPPKALNPEDDKINILFKSIIEIINNSGKPREIIICDSEIKNILSDLCKILEIKITVRKNLPSLNKIRKELFQFS